MTDVEQQSFDVRIKVHDLYLIILWDTSYFEPRPSDRICGRRVAESLFSIEAFASNSKPQHRVAKALADAIRPELAEQIKNVEESLKQSLSIVTAELDDPLIKAVDVTMPPQTDYPFTIEKGKGTPLVNGFIRLFVLVDLITGSLKELHWRGAISKKDYKKREDTYSKPLRKVMNDLNIIIKRYHEQRKAISPK
jgi:hypothetical protein